MIVCFIKTGKAFLPELNAYVGYLNKNNIKTIVCDSIEQARNVDATIYYRFGGFLYKKVKSGVPEIHEYHTISTGGVPILKNIIKSFFSIRPHGLSFLNYIVERKYFFNKRIPKIYRDMGAEVDFFNVRKMKKEKIYDIAYIGSISTRKGLVKTIENLAKKNISLVLIGNISDTDKEKLLAYKNIKILGVCDQQKIIDTLCKVRFGLNYIPNEYPLNIQTSTKVIEYLVAGLPIISNKYTWIEEHSLLNNYRYINLDDVDDYLNTNNSNYISRGKYILSELEIKKFYWEFILDDIDFISFIKGIEKNVY